MAETCGISKDDLFIVAKLFATGATGDFANCAATLSLYCQGLNQPTSGTAKNAALINLHLATRQIGQPGAGPFSLTGQPNTMGGREVGGLTNLMSGHRDMANAGHRAEVAALWGVPGVPSSPGKSAVEMSASVAVRVFPAPMKTAWRRCKAHFNAAPTAAPVCRSSSAACARHGQHSRAQRRNGW